MNPRPARDDASPPEDVSGVTTESTPALQPVHAPAGPQYPRRDLS